jgi:hypothetical protein
MMIQIVDTQILNAVTNYQKSSLDLHTKITTSCSRIFKYQPPPYEAEAEARAWASCSLALFSMIMTRSKTKAQSAPAFTVTVYVGLPNHLDLTATCGKPPNDDDASDHAQKIMYVCSKRILKFQNFVKLIRRS